MSAFEGLSATPGLSICDLPTAGDRQMYGRNPAGTAALQLGMITGALAVGAMSCHERGLAAMRAQREQREVDGLAYALSEAGADNAELAALARQALERLDEVLEENRILRQACADRDEILGLLRNQPRHDNDA